MRLFPHILFGSFILDDLNMISKKRLLYMISYKSEYLKKIFFFWKWLNNYSIKYLLIIVRIEFSIF